MVLGKVFSNCSTGWATLWTCFRATANSRKTCLRSSGSCGARSTPASSPSKSMMEHFVLREQVRSGPGWRRWSSSYWLTAANQRGSTSSTIRDIPCCPKTAPHSFWPSHRRRTDRRPWPIGDAGIGRASNLDELGNRVYSLNVRVVAGQVTGALARTAAHIDDQPRDGLPTPARYPDHSPRCAQCPQAGSHIRPRERHRHHEPG